VGQLGVEAQQEVVRFGWRRFALRAQSVSAVEFAQWPAAMMAEK
jgi:hypothetical protein